LIVDNNEGSQGFKRVEGRGGGRRPPLQAAGFRRLSELFGSFRRFSEGHFLGKGRGAKISPQSGVHSPQSGDRRARSDAPNPVGWSKRANLGTESKCVQVRPSASKQKSGSSIFVRLRHRRAGRWFDRRSSRHGGTRYIRAGASRARSCQVVLGGATVQSPIPINDIGTTAMAGQAQARPICRLFPAISPLFPAIPRYSPLFPAIPQIRKKFMRAKGCLKDRNPALGRVRIAVTDRTLHAGTRSAFWPPTSGIRPQTTLDIGLQTLDFPFPTPSATLSSSPARFPPRVGHGSIEGCIPFLIFPFEFIIF
jgi:hypothetical protein